MPETVDTMSQMSLDFDPSTSAHNLTQPSGYKGLYAFHKYWGKKPAETVSFLIERLSSPGGLVVDPFLGSGAVARESALRRRKFIGCDINPAAVELASFLAAPASSPAVADAYARLEADLRPEIDASYRTSHDAIATHYLWHQRALMQVWVKGERGRLRRELAPTDRDSRLFEQFQNYSVRALRPLNIFKNSRINAKANMQWRDMFTGRALRNLELLRGAIMNIPEKTTRQALILALTASIGQMSNMVFAIESRGKRSGSSGRGRMEVGSWVIGFWCPELHFEVNAWNCFANKATALLRATRSIDGSALKTKVSLHPADVLDGRASVAVANADAVELLTSLPDGSIELLVTDPPHGDRIPYLELSELWNAVIGKLPEFSKEIVISDASERSLNSARYVQRMEELLQVVKSKLRPDGCVALMFNSRSSDEWRALMASCSSARLAYVGCFPMTYSAGSVVQDNRDGALRHDYVLIFSSCSNATQSPLAGARLRELPNWSTECPNVEA